LTGVSNKVAVRIALGSQRTDGVDGGNPRMNPALAPT
jgi:hypothetical protein